MEQLQTKSFSDEKIKVSGLFSLKVFDSAGNLVAVQVEKNLVVRGGLNAVGSLLAGDTSGDKLVAQIGFGSNSTPANIEDTALTDSFTKDILSTSNPVPNALQYDFTLELTENNGATIREFGLFTAEGTLFARKIRAADIVKTSDVRLEGSWTISII